MDQRLATPDPAASFCPAGRRDLQLAARPDVRARGTGPASLTEAAAATVRHLLSALPWPAHGRASCTQPRPSARAS